jgi:hypothetical protein
MNCVANAASDAAGARIKDHEEHFRGHCSLLNDPLPLESRLAGTMPDIESYGHSGETMLKDARLSRAWLIACCMLTLHVVDNAVTDFVGYYNSTVLALYGHFSWFPRLDTDFRTWLIAATCALIVPFALTSLVDRHLAVFARLAYVFAAYLLLDGCGHIAASLLGHTVPSVHFQGLSPGFYSSPFLVAASGFLFWTARKANQAWPTAP